MMKKLLPFACAAFVALGATGPALAHEDHGKPQHGGIVAEAAHYQAELVASAERLTLFITDHGKPLPTAGGSAKLTLLVAGKKSEVTLAPAGDNRFEASGSFTLGGARAVASLNVPGQPAKTLRFVLDDAHQHRQHESH
jgi:hypothetical protein